METTADVLFPGCAPAELFEHVESLDRYPAWMRLVHRVDDVPVADGDPPMWDVELRARVGPFARSKRLRMCRTVFEPDRRVRFERIPTDGRDHAAWVLEATVEPVGDGCRLAMQLGYSGDLWGGAALRHVLDEEIRRGRDALRELLTVRS